MNSTAQAEAAAAAAAGAAAMKEALRIFNTELWTLYAFGVAFTIFRTYARVKAVGWRELRPDDYLVWLAVVCTTRSYMNPPAVFANEVLSAGAIYHPINSDLRCSQPCWGCREQFYDRRSASCFGPYFSGICQQVCHGLPVLATMHTDKDPCRVFGSKIQVVGWTFYVCLIATLKISVLFFYIRLMVSLQNSLGDNAY